MAGGFALALLMGGVEAVAGDGIDGPTHETVVAIEQGDDAEGHDHHDHEAPTDSEGTDHHEDHGCDGCACFAPAGGCSVPLNHVANPSAPSPGETTVGSGAPNPPADARSAFDIFRPPRS